MKLCTAATATLALAGSSAYASPGKKPKDKEPRCRFALDWTTEEIIADPDKFAWDMLYWEGNFHQDGIAFNKKNGMSLDGRFLDFYSGKPSTEKTFSASSKEALQIMLYTHAITGNPEAARFLSPKKPKKAAKIVTDLMEKKLDAYLRFNETYPGHGGFLPWMTTGNKDGVVTPTPDWHDRVPGLDNGQLVWAVYGFIHALEESGTKSHRKLAAKWQKWLDYTKTTVDHVFYDEDGRVCAVTAMADETLPPWHPDQTYACETETYLDDPYEGELLTFWLHIFSGLSEGDKDAMWEYKRWQLIEDEYEQGGVGPVTVERGFWFSSHEPWKVLQLPYYDSDIMRRVYHNAERVRTCNAVVTECPGLYASVNNFTDPATGEVGNYISPAGIPSIANNTDQYHEVATPYASWPTIMFDRGVGLAWWHNMVSGKKMQNQYGSTESFKIDGTGVGSLLTWDSKVLTVVALLGGAKDVVRDGMKKDGIYEEFLTIVNRDYGRTFSELKGEDVELCLPEHSVPHEGLEDYTTCKA